MFIPNWRIHHELNLLATSEFICRQSPVLFILTYTAPSHSPSLSLSLLFLFLALALFLSSGIPSKFPKDPLHSPRVSILFSFHNVPSFFSSLLECGRHFRPLGKFPTFLSLSFSLSSPINSIFLRIHNFLLNSEKCGSYKRFKLLPGDVKHNKKIAVLISFLVRKMDVLLLRLRSSSQLRSSIRSFVHSPGLNWRAT